MKPLIGVGKIGCYLALAALSSAGATRAQAQWLVGPSTAVPVAETVAPLAETVAEAEAAGDGSDATSYADGRKAIQEGRWADAESIFDKVAQDRGGHAEGSLYWKAYAENKQGKSDAALKSCAALRQSYPSSHWIEDCGALEIEIRGKNGQPVEPQSQQDANLKVLALDEMMRQDEARALPEAEKILAGSDPENRKEEVLFVLARRGSKGAQKLLTQVARPDANMPSGIRSNLGLQTRAQQLVAALRGATAPSPAGYVTRRVGLDVVVTDAAGTPVTGLGPQDFTVLDNSREAKIQSLHAFGPAAGGESSEDAEVMILIDTVNTPVLNVAYARDQIESFLRENGGKLAYPVSLYLFNGKGAQCIAPASRDGNVLIAALEKAGSNLRPIRRAEGFWGAVERLQFSLGTLGSLATEEAKKPGRKLLLWISPGWPLLMGEDVWGTNRETKTMFDEIVALSTGLRQARISICSLDPVRVTASDELTRFEYESYRKPVTKANNAKDGDLALQILAEQSGGEVRSSTSVYLSQEIAHCVAHAGSYYFLSINAPPAEHIDEFHALTITVNKPGLAVRTRNGYYNEP